MLSNGLLCYLSNPPSSRHLNINTTLTQQAEAAKEALHASYEPQVGCSLPRASLIDCLADPLWQAFGWDASGLHPMM